MTEIVSTPARAACKKEDGPGGLRQVPPRLLAIFNKTRGGISPLTSRLQIRMHRRNFIGPEA
jgi:hypothetical protein